MLNNRVKGGQGKERMTKPETGLINYNSAQSTRRSKQVVLFWLLIYIQLLIYITHRYNLYKGCFINIYFPKDLFASWFLEGCVYIFKLV